jgi:high-affinity iron transporter
MNQQSMENGGMANQWPEGPAPIFVTASKRKKNVFLTVIIVALVVVLSALVWQGITASGNPDPNAEHLSPTAVVLDTGILVFREGLEAILVLAALTASLVRTEQGYWKPVALGSALAFVASIVTWFIAVGILSDINVPELDIQAATGLLAVVVLLIIVNFSRFPTFL